MLQRTKLADELANRIFPVGACSQAANLAIRFGYCNRYRFGMDIQTQKSKLLFHDRFPPLVALDWRSQQTQPNPRLAHRAGHTIMTTECVCWRILRQATI